MFRRGGATLRSLTCKTVQRIGANGAPAARMRKRLALAGFPAECDEWALGMIREAEKCSMQDGEFSAVKTDVV